MGTRISGILKFCSYYVDIGEVCDISKINFDQNTVLCT